MITAEPPRWAALVALISGEDFTCPTGYGSLSIMRTRSKLDRRITPLSELLTTVPLPISSGISTSIQQDPSSVKHFRRFWSEI